MLKLSKEELIRGLLVHSYKSLARELKVTRQEILNLKEHYGIEEPLPRLRLKYQHLIEDLPGEVWKDFLLYNCPYKVSNMGRLKSVGGEYRDKKVIRCKLINIDQQGYFSMNVKEVPKRLRIRNFVAEQFVPNPHNLTGVVNIDGDPSNNRADNLAWVKQEPSLAEQRKDLRPSRDEMLISLKELTITEYANKLDIPRSTLCSWIKACNIPSSQRDLDYFLDRRLSKIF